MGNKYKNDGWESADGENFCERVVLYPMRKLKRMVIKAILIALVVFGLWQLAGTWGTGAETMPVRPVSTYNQTYETNQTTVHETNVEVFSNNFSNNQIGGCQNRNNGFQDCSYNEQKEPRGRIDICLHSDCPYLFKYDPTWDGE